MKISVKGIKSSNKLENVNWIHLALTLFGHRGHPGHRVVLPVALEHKTEIGPAGVQNAWDPLANHRPV